MSSRILIVGAGFAGATYARTLAEAGHDVTVIDKRNHLGGNAYDKVDGNGVRIHVYGPHLFHTKNVEVADWLRRFATFVPYRHKVRAKLPDGRTVPLPINIDTINTIFATSFKREAEVEAHLRSVSLPVAAAQSAADYLYARIGQELTDLLFRPYTKKMWMLDLEDIASSVVKRIPLRLSSDDSYFDADEVQMLPAGGYVKVFESIFDHPRIEVKLGVPFEKSMLDSVRFCFSSMPIDEFYEYSLGALPYRSIRFHHRTEYESPKQEWSVTNFTDDGPFTRETAWHVMPGHRCIDTGRFTYTKEEPCDYRDNELERYYPVKTSDDRFGRLYKQYKQHSETHADRICFIGRCGTYQYLDMDQVINQSLIGARAWIRARAERPH